MRSRAGGRLFKAAVRCEIERLWHLELCFGLKRRSVFTVVVAAVVVSRALPWDRSGVVHRLMTVLMMCLPLIGSPLLFSGRQRAFSTGGFLARVVVGDQARKKFLERSAVVLEAVSSMGHAAR